MPNKGGAGDRSKGGKEGAKGGAKGPVSRERSGLGRALVTLLIRSGSSVPDSQSPIKKKSKSDIKKEQKSNNKK